MSNNKYVQMSAFCFIAPFYLVAWAADQPVNESERIEDCAKIENFRTGKVIKDRAKEKEKEKGRHENRAGVHNKQVPEPKPCPSDLS